MYIVTGDIRRIMSLLRHDFMLYLILEYDTKKREKVFLSKQVAGDIKRLYLFSLCFPLFPLMWVVFL